MNQNLSSQVKVVLIILLILVYINLSKKPDVDPTPNPIPTNALKVLVVEESSDRYKLPASQRLIWTSPEIDKFIGDHQGEMRIIDKDEKVTDAPKWVQDGKARPRKSLPWQIISNGKNFYEGELPLTVEEELKLLEKYVK